MMSPLSEFTITTTAIAAFHAAKIIAAESFVGPAMREVFGAVEISNEYAQRGRFINIWR